MKKKVTIIAIFLVALVFSTDVSAQDFSSLDKSPHDISYFKTSRKTPPSIKVLYGRPQKKGRTVFGNLVPYGKIWRTGANEATEITFFSDVTFGGKEIKAGTYTLFTIPEKKSWTIILNSARDVWGAYYYDEEKDIARIKVPAKRIDVIEAFSIAFEKETNGGNMVLAWDNISVSIPFSF